MQLLALRHRPRADFPSEDGRPAVCVHARLLRSLKRLGQRDPIVTVCFPQHARIPHVEVQVAALSLHVARKVRPDVAKGELASGATAHGPAGIVCPGPHNGPNAWGSV